MIGKYHSFLLMIMCVMGGGLVSCQPTTVAPPPIDALAGQSGELPRAADLLTPSLVPPMVTAAADETLAPDMRETVDGEWPQGAALAGGPGTDQKAVDSTVIATSLPLAASAAPTTGASSAQIISFTASPAQVNPGGTVTLSWQAVGTKANLITDTPDGLSKYQSVPLTGTLTITLPAYQRYSISFSLIVSGDNTTSASEYASVKILCTDTWFFDEDLDPYSLCPLPSKVYDATMQTFEHGFMMWIKANDLVYAFIDGYTYTREPDKWDPSMPESDPTLSPPPGMYQPVRGFGLAWRNWTSFADGVARPLKDVLGWATAPEVAFAAVSQHSGPIHPRSGKLETWFFRDANGRIIAAYISGGWKVVKQ